jgi:hypothetical protein
LSRWVFLLFCFVLCGKRTSKYPWPGLSITLESSPRDFFLSCGFRSGRAVSEGTSLCVSYDFATDV